MITGIYVTVVFHDDRFSALPGKGAHRRRGSDPAVQSPFKIHNKGFTSLSRLSFFDGAQRSAEGKRNASEIADCKQACAQ